jgi:hypothetical protein
VTKFELGDTLAQEKTSATKSIWGAGRAPYGAFEELNRLTDVATELYDFLYGMRFVSLTYIYI